MSDEKFLTLFCTAMVAFGIFVLGMLTIRLAPANGYIDSAILYLAVVIGTGLYWIGRKLDK